MMIELRNKEQMRKVIRKAFQVRPFVRVRGFRWYEVMSSDGSNVYTIHFYKEGKRRLGECNCKGAEKGYVCYHLAASAAVHISIASMRRAS